MEKIVLENFCSQILHRMGQIITPNLIQKFCSDKIHSLCFEELIFPLLFMWFDFSSTNIGKFDLCFSFKN
jgi:hypothetical protein